MINIIVFKCKISTSEAFAGANYYAKKTIIEMCEMYEVAKKSISEVFGFVVVMEKNFMTG